MFLIPPTPAGSLLNCIRWFWYLDEWMTSQTLRQYVSSLWLILLSECSFAESVSVDPFFVVELTANAGARERDTSRYTNRSVRKSVVDFIQRRMFAWRIWPYRVTCFDAVVGRFVKWLSLVTAILSVFISARDVGNSAVSKIIFEQSN